MDEDTAGRALALSTTFENGLNRVAPDASDTVTENLPVSMTCVFGYKVHIYTHGKSRQKRFKLVESRTN